MTKSPAAALEDALRDADQEVVALGALGWHLRASGSPEREMFRAKLEVAGELCLQLRRLGMAPPPVKLADYDKPAPVPDPARKLCEAKVRPKCPHFARPGGKFCYYHSGGTGTWNPTVRVFVGDREVSTVTTTTDPFTMAAAPVEQRCTAKRRGDSSCTCRSHSGQNPFAHAGDVIDREAEERRIDLAVKQAAQITKFANALIDELGLDRKRVAGVLHRLAGGINPEYLPQSGSRDPDVPPDA